MEKETRVVMTDWMLRDHVPEVLRIEAESFEYAWDLDDFVRCLRQRNCIGRVALHDDRVVGFMVYGLSKTRIHLLNLAVASAERRRDVGTQMVADLIGRLSVRRRTWIALEVRETNLPAQLFFQYCGFRATGVLRGYYDETDEDAYLMDYQRMERPGGVCRQKQTTNAHR